MTGFAELVRKSGLLPLERLAFAIEEQKRTGFRLGQILVDHGIVEETDLYDAIAAASKCTRLDMSTAQVDLQVARTIDPEWALEKRMMPLSLDREEGTVVVATSDPTQFMLLAELGARLTVRAVPQVATESELGRLIRHAYFREPLDRTSGGTTPPAHRPLPPPLPSQSLPPRADPSPRSLPPFPTSQAEPSRTHPPPGESIAPKGLAYPTRSGDGRASAVPATAPSERLIEPAVGASTSPAPSSTPAPLSRPPAPHFGETRPGAANPSTGPFDPVAFRRDPAITSADLSLSELAPVVEMHQSTASAIQAIFELCVARGLITREEYLTRLGTYDLPKGQIE